MNLKLSQYDERVKSAWAHMNERGLKQAGTKSGNWVVPDGVVVTDQDRATAQFLADQFGTGRLVSVWGQFL